MTGSLAFMLPVPRQSSHTPAAARTQTERAVVHLTDVGLIDVSKPFEILVFSSYFFRVGLGVDSLTTRADTVRLNYFPAITADVSDADVHIVLLGRGNIRVGGRVTGGPALAVGATGKHIVLLKGGVGIRDEP